MVKVDLVTGFLGSGKTTFIKKYVRYLTESGERVCVLENDFGAVNVDTMLLGELSEIGCGMEMVSGACDSDCHKRRFKTKLIAIAMSGYTRVVIEPSGVFDVDEFFDTLHEPPLESWCRISSVIAIADLDDSSSGSETDDYFLASQAAVAGVLLFSKCRSENDPRADRASKRISGAMKAIRCGRAPSSYCIVKPWDSLTAADMSRIADAGFAEPSFAKLHADTARFSSVYFMNTDLTAEKLRVSFDSIIGDSECGHVLRLKGFTFENGRWFEINAARTSFDCREVKNGQSVIIVIGENIIKERIAGYLS